MRIHLIIYRWWFWCTDQIGSNSQHGSLDQMIMLRLLLIKFPPWGLNYDESFNTQSYSHRVTNTVLLSSLLIAYVRLEQSSLYLQQSIVKMHCAFAHGDNEETNAPLVQPKPLQDSFIQIEALNLKGHGWSDMVQLNGRKQYRSFRTESKYNWYDFIFCRHKPIVRGQRMTPLTPILPTPF